MRTFAAIITCLAVVGCSPTVYTHGIPNLVQVEPGLWRSGQPTSIEQWRYLRTLGIHDVIKLNYEHEGSDADAIKAGLVVHNFSIPPDGLTSVLAPIDGRVVDAAEKTIAAGRGVLVHCTHGQDRTGLVIGLWRMQHDGWTKVRAYDEMLRLNFHPLLRNLQEFWEQQP